MALADTARLVASLELQDKFSATANKFDRTLGNTERRLATLERVGYQTGRGLRNAADNLKTIGIITAGALAFQVKAGIDSLTQLAEIENQTAAVIESTGQAANVSADHIRERAEALEELTTIDDKAIQSGQNMLLTFTNIRNEVGEGNDIFDQATDAILDLSVAMGTEPKQAALQLGKALNDPVRGLTALRRVGVAFTEDQEDQIKTLVESGKTMEAQKVILAELNKEFGNSAEAFGEGPGATMRRFGDAVEGAQQALATGFLPVMEKVSRLAQDFLSDPQVIANITKFGEGLAGGVEDLVDIGMNLPWDAIGESAKLMGQGARALLQAFTSLPPWVQTAVLTGWGLNKLTGGALGNIAATLTKAAFGSIRGGTPATPVFTKEVGLPGGGTGVGGPVGGGLGRFGSALGLLGFVGIAVTAANALKDLEESIDGVGFAASKTGHGLFDNLFGPPQNPSTPQGQFVPENKGGVVPVNVTKLPPAAFKSTELAIDHLNDEINRNLKNGDVLAAARDQRTLATLHRLNGTVDTRTNRIAIRIGEVNQGLSKANRNLSEGNQRQRDIAQRVSEARERIGSGFQATNAQLGALNRKDFSPNVNVTVPVTTNVSVSDIMRSATVYNVATSLSSQTRAGFRP